MHYLPTRAEDGCSALSPCPDLPKLSSVASDSAEACCCCCCCCCAATDFPDDGSGTDVFAPRACDSRLALGAELPACVPGCTLTAAEPEATSWEAARGERVVSMRLGGRAERQVATARMEGSSDLESRTMSESGW